MPNPLVIQRLSGIQIILNGVYQASASMSSSAKGTERESLIDEFLSKVLPPVYRFGTGDATDVHGNKSGQLDVVVEYPFSPCLPSVGASSSRLYLAEGVAAVIEVKSNIQSQLSEAVNTANQLAPIRRTFGSTMTMGRTPSIDIPLFVVSYTGWKTMASLQQNINAAPNIDGILVIDSGLFISSVRLGSIQAQGPFALWALICCLHQVTASLQAAGTNPLVYGV